MRQGNLGLRRQHAEKLMKLSAAHLPTGDFASLEASDAEKFAVVVVTKARGDRETMCPPRCMASKARIHTHTHMIIYIYTCNM